MSKLESEIYINRALLWLIIAYVAFDNGASKPLVVVDAAVAILNFISAYVIGRESDDS